MKSDVLIKTEAKEYKDMTFDQIKKMVEYLNQGMSENEAKEKAMNNE